MLGIQDLWLFILSGLLLNITPGPDTAYIVGRSVQAGWRGGAAAAMGISVGCLVHIVAASVGLSAILATSSMAFTVIKVLGAGYLCYIGVRMLLTRDLPSAPEAAAQPGAMSLRQIFWQGALTNALNPKVALFFLAFVPQFMAQDTEGKAVAFAVLGVIFNLTGTAWNLTTAAVAARAAGRLGQSRRVRLWTSRCIGAVFV